MADVRRRSIAAELVPATVPAIGDEVTVVPVRTAVPVAKFGAVETAVNRKPDGADKFPGCPKNNRESDKFSSFKLRLVG